MQQREKSIIVPVEVKEVPSFDSVSEVLSAQKDKASNDIKKDLYPRDGTLPLGIAERSAGELIPIDARNLLFVASGMTAEIEAV